jgi:prolyl-tRNA synthetase
VMAMPVVEGHEERAARSSPARCGPTRIEALMGDGRALQAGTSHNLGQNFAKAFEHHVPGARQSRCSTSGARRGACRRGCRRGDHGARRRQRAGAAAADRAVSGRHRADRPRQLARDGAAPRPRRFTRLQEGRYSRHPRRARGATRRKFAEWEQRRRCPLPCEIGTEGHRKIGGAGRRAATPARSRACRWRPREQLRSPASTRSSRNLLHRAPRVRPEHTCHAVVIRQFQADDGGAARLRDLRCAATRRCEAQIKTDTQATIRNMPIGGAAPSGTCIHCDKPAVAEAWFAKSY